jgi:Mg-chelatase subunit ChlD
MNNPTYITIVLDRSGSMEEIATQTIAGFNSFLKEQQSVKGDAKITLVQFDHEYQPVYEAIDLQKAPALNRKSYVPRGMTALLDAIGATIKSTRAKIKLMKEHERPSKVIFVVITDGHENHSRQYSRRDIFNKISKMEEKHKWEFVFLGANQDAIDEAGRLGVKAHKAMTFAADEHGTNAMFFDLSRNIAECRENDIDFNFSPEQRKKQQREN